MESAEIRARWLRFFESNNSLGLTHTVVPSASLIADDPNLLLVNAGMVPFKPYFLGESTPPYKRATSVQKCVRTLDIDEVGKTTRHASFFQMCGNFSFGDYFKEDAISFAWEFLTEVLKLPADRLLVTVYETDDEAFDIWNKKVGVPADRIVRIGDKEGRNSELYELQAESVSYVVLKHYELPTTQHTTYLALWKANKEKIQDNLEVISKVAQFIITKIDEEAARHEKNKEEKRL